MSKFVLTAQLQLQAPGNVKQIVQQIQSQLNGVNVNIQVQNAGQAQKQIQQVAQATNQATTAAERMGKAFALSIRRFAAFSIATRAVGLFTSTLSDAIQTSIDFERQLIKISQVTGKSVSQLRGLTKEITSLSTGFGVASSDLLEVSTILAQAGLSADDTSIALRTLAKAALAPNFDSISETAEGAIAILAQFQEGVGSLEKQLGSINAVAGAFAVEASDLIDVIRRTGGVFKASGGDLNELLALFTSIRATTRESAESIGTGLRTILTRIQRPKTIEYLKQFGVELVDLNGKFIGPYEAIKQLSAALAGLGEGDLTFISIAEELGGFRQIGKVLPLLQQFSTAQSALNVAMKAGDSLTKDAASAQAALAVRIMKVKEEFLALIRSVTETSTFQIMANTALSLASALIKIGDSIKPLLPMLAALAAFRLAKGLGGFFGGMMSGAASGRTYNKGGKVLGFARGGLVPGTGNRDTVPAMLAPGEFVIRKSSVNKMGAGTLAAMNNNRYAAGGIVSDGRYTYGGKPLSIAQISRNAAYGSEGYSEKAIRDLKTSDPAKYKKLEEQAALNIVKNKNAVEEAKYNKSTDKLKSKYPGGVFTTVPGTIGGFFLSPEKGSDSPYKLSKPYPFKMNDGKMAAIKEGSEINNYVPFRNDIAKLTNLNNVIDNSSKNSLAKAVTGISPQLEQLFSNNGINFNESSISNAANRLVSDNNGKINNAVSTVAGYVYEGVINGITGASLAGGTESFDFPSVASNRSSLARMFGSNESEFATLIKGDAKRSQNSKSNMSIFKKIANDIKSGKVGIPNGILQLASGGLVQKFAEGGEVLERGTQKYLISDVVKGMRELQGNQALSQKDAIALFNSKDARGDFVYSNFGGPGSIKLPKWMGTYRPQSAAYGVFQKAQAEKQNRIAGAMSRQGKTMRDYETRREFATGGGVGTDTVPALLTPGEFVVNRSSAQRIGYSNLNRMNKVGKYANGGVVQHFAAGSSGTGVSSNSTGSLNAFNQFFSAVSNNTQAVNSNSTAQKKLSKSAMEVVNNNKMFAASMASSIIQGFLPAIDENSSVVLKMTSGFLGLITTISSVGFALESFGVKLSAQGLLKGAMGEGFSIGSMKNMMGGFRSMGLSKSMSSSLTGGVQATAKLAGPLLAAAAAAVAVTEGFNAIISSMYDYNAQLKKAIESGNVSSAEKYAGKKYDVTAANSSRQAFGYGGAAIGAAIGSFAGPLGTIAGAAIGAAAGTIIGTVLASVAPSWAEGINVALGGNTRDSVVKLAAAQAGAVKTQKQLDEAQKLSTSLMKDFQNGLISSIEVFKRLDEKSQIVTEQQVRGEKSIAANLKNRSEFNGLASGKLNRNVIPNFNSILGLVNAIGGDAALRNTLTLGGTIGESASARNQRINKENADLINQTSIEQAKSFDINSEARSAMMRSRLFAGDNPEAAREEAKKTLRQQREQAIQTAKVLAQSGAGEDDPAYQAAIDQMEQIRQQLQQVDKEFANLEKEVKAAKEKFAALNLGFRSIISASDAAALKMDNLMSSFEAGNLPAARAAATLEAAMTSAGQNIKKVDFDSALNEVNGVFKAFGASQQQIDKFNGLLQGVAGVQREFPSIFETLKKELISGELKDINNPRAVGQKFKDIVGAQLKASNIAPAIQEQILAAMGDVKLDSEDVSKIVAGDYSVLEKYLGDAGEEVKKNMKAVIDNYIKVNQQLIEATKKRIDAERNLVEAQKEALDLIMEGREIQAKYGGREVTNQERRQNLLAKSNVEGSRLGLSNMRTGDVPELRRRNLEIMGGFASVEDGRRRNGLEGVRGAEANEFQKDLEKTYKTQIDTIRSLIKLEEDQLKIIQEKNKLEKESLESLAKGDIESFFKQQAAVGARAAIASGDQRSMNLYGSEALGAAASDIQRQKDAGVQSLYGQRLGGAGGLAEAAASAVLSSMGVTDMRSAQIMAGTTGEEEASKSRLRELGGLLGETGQIGVQMAEMQVGTATIQAEKAELIVTNLANGGNSPVQNRANGGLIYASRGMFVPRGSDTVPAMLTPGEFVVNRAAVQRGNNLQILSAMNGGSSSSSSTQSESVKMSRGGVVKYFEDGGKVDSNGSNPMGSFDNQIMNKFAESLSSFNRNLTLNIDKLKQTSINIKLDSTNVNVNLNDGGLLKALKEEVKQELLTVISNQFKLDNNGNIRRNQTVLG